MKTRLSAIISCVCIESSVSGGGLDLVVDVTGPYIARGLPPLSSTLPLEVSLRILGGAVGDER